MGGEGGGGGGLLKLCLAFAVTAVDHVVAGEQSIVPAKSDCGLGGSSWCCCITRAMFY